MFPQCRSRGLRHRTSSIARLAAVASAAALAAAACTLGTDPDAPDADALKPSTYASNLDPSRQPPAAPIEDAARGGVLTARTVQLPSMDPSNAYYSSSVSILSGLVTRSLTQYVYDPDQDTMILVPDIATDLGTPNDDYTEWTYTIRDGVKFEDGTDVTADDVAYGIKRSFDRKTFPEGAAYSNDYFLHGDTYAGPYRDGTNYDGIEVDGNTLTLKMAKPFPDMPYWGTFPAIGPIPEGAADPDTYALHPLATGPYKFANYVPEKSLTLVRNGQWDPDTDPGRHQYPDKIHIMLTGDQAKVDASIFQNSGLGRTSIDIDQPSAEVLQSALEDKPELIAIGPDPCVFVIAMDYRKITDLRVRQAVGYAVRYDGLATAAGEIDGLTTEPGRTLLPPGSPGRIEYNPLSTEPGSSDPGKARALLGAAGYRPGDYVLRFAYWSLVPETVAVARALERALEAGGFKVALYRTTTEEQWDAVRGDADSPLNLRISGWCSDWPSGSASLVALLSSHSDLVPNVSSFFAEPEIDEAIQRTSELPLVNQGRAWAALDKKIETEYYPYVVTRYGRSVQLHGSAIGGMHSDEILTSPTWKDLFVVH